MEKVSKLAAGTIQVKWDVEDNVIRCIEINGDFFAGRRLDELCRRLTGCSYERHSVYEVLLEQDCDNLIYGISKEELLDVMF